MITLENVTRKFGSFVAVDNLSMTVPKGQVLGFLGPNGAGKTTTMRMISGFLTPSAGKITVCGYDVAENPVEVKRHIGYMPEVASSYNDMTVLSFLNFIAEARGLSGSAKEKPLKKSLPTYRCPTFYTSRSIRCPKDTSAASDWRRRWFTIRPF